MQGVVGEVSETKCASQGAFAVLRADVSAHAAGLQALVEGTEARFELKANADDTRRIEAELGVLKKAVGEKLGVGAAQKLFEHKADQEALKKLAADSQRETNELQRLQIRVEIAEGAVASAHRAAFDADEHVRASAAALSQLQSATDKHWQITQSSREEQGKAYHPHTRR